MPASPLYVLHVLSVVFLKRDRDVCIPARTIARAFLARWRERTPSPSFTLFSVAAAHDIRSVAGIFIRRF